MIRPLARAAALLVALPYLVLASSLAPEHVHEPGGHAEGHAVAHSHFGPHGVSSHQDDNTEIEHDIEHVIWLDSAALHEGMFYLVRSVAVASANDELIPFSTRWVVVEHDDAAPPHGPPKLARQHRGPPCLSV